MSAPEPVKAYFDFKSPYAYLALGPALALDARYDIDLEWVPFALKIREVAQRSETDQQRIRYSYMDVRRWANRRGGLVIKGPRRIYDSTPALIGGLLARREGIFPAYAERVFRGFFARELEIDDPHAIAEVFAAAGGPADALQAFAAGEGPAELEASRRRADEDGVFGVPTFVCRGELFWGHDRIPLLEERLTEIGRKRA